MHARVQVQASIGGLSLGVAQHSSPQISETQRGPVEHCVLGVVEETVGHHQVEICLEVGHRAVGVTFQLRAHCREVHRLADELQVVWDLLRGKEHTDGTN